jgi:hypothetical protein
MDEDNKLMRKGGTVKGISANDDEMKLINKFTLEPLEKEQVYVFEVIACDNEIDRDFERFDDKALAQLAKHFVGKTVIKDHQRRADNQFARVYSAEVQEASKTTSDGQPLKQLVVKCYTLANEQNAGIIAEIKAGIKKEVSISFLPASVKCSICGTDRRKKYCEHWWGKEYDGQTCHFTLTNIKDAYELSFVAVPAQRGAGTKKDYLSGEEAEPEQVEKQEDSLNEAPDEGAFLLEKELEMQMLIESAFLEIESMKEEL